MLSLRSNLVGNVCWAKTTVGAQFTLLCSYLCIMRKYLIPKQRCKHCLMFNGWWYEWFFFLCYTYILGFCWYDRIHEEIKHVLLTLVVAGTQAKVFDLSLGCNCFFVRKHFRESSREKHNWSSIQILHFSKRDRMNVTKTKQGPPLLVFSFVFLNKWT